MGIILESKRGSFKASVVNIQKTFAKIKEETPDLLKDLTFSEGDRFPFSRELESVFFRLEMSEFMSLKNPTYGVFEINPGAETKYKERIAPKIEQHSAEVRKAADIFGRLIDQSKQQTL